MFSARVFLIQRTRDWLYYSGPYLWVKSPIEARFYKLEENARDKLAGIKNAKTEARVVELELAPVKPEEEDEYAKL